MWVYIKTESNLFTVGFYDPNDEFQTDSDHSTKNDAAKRCNYLNGKKNDG